MEPLTEDQKELYDWLVQYINTSQYAPSIRQMMKAMKLKSPAPIQSRLERLRAKGYIDWTEGQARTIRITDPGVKGVPILCAIAAGGLVEPFTDYKETLDLSGLIQQPNYFALRVVGDSMIDDNISEGDLVIMRKVYSPRQVKNGSIVAARVEGHGTTLKRLYRRLEQITLKPANSNYSPIYARAKEVQVQGVLVGIWRTC